MRELAQVDRKLKAAARKSRDKSSRSRRAVLRYDNLHLAAEPDEAVTLQCRIVAQAKQNSGWENSQWHNIYYVIALESQLFELRQLRQLDKIANIVVRQLQTFEPGKARQAR